MRDIQPGQATSRQETVAKYYTPTKPIGLRNMIMSDELMRLAIETVCANIPMVNSSRELKQVNLPFMSKHTNVSFPY